MTIVRILFLSFLGSAVLTGCKNNPSSTVSTKEKPQFAVYNFEELEPLLNRDDNAIHIVNFWATWCKPCIEELPVFQEIHDTDKNIEVLLVSLDFPDKVDEQLKPFIRKQHLTPPVVLLDDPHENVWIPKVDSTWSGAIPATLIYNKEKRLFYERSFTRETLSKELEKFTKH